MIELLENLLLDNYMLTYENIETEAAKRYPSDMYQRIAFINGAIFVMKNKGLEKELKKSFEK